MVKTVIAHSKTNSIRMIPEKVKFGWKYTGNMPTPIKLPH